MTDREVALHVERDDLWDGQPERRLELPAHALEALPAYVALPSGVRYRDRRADALRVETQR